MRWIEKAIERGDTIIDLGAPTFKKNKPGPFYEMEKTKVFGEHYE